MRDAVPLISLHASPVLPPSVRMLASVITQTCSFSYKVLFCSQSAAEEGRDMFSRVLLVDIREIAGLYCRGGEEGSRERKQDQHRSGGQQEKLRYGKEGKR